MEQRSFLVAGRSIGALIGLLLTAGSALAAPRDAEATGLVEEAVLDYAAKKWKPAKAKLKKALKACGKNQCSDAVRARTYRALGAVEIAGLENAQAGSEALAHAVQADPEALFERNLATKDVLEAYVEMGGPSGTVKAPSPSKSAKKPSKAAPSAKKKPQKAREEEEEGDEGEGDEEEEIVLEEEPDRAEKASARGTLAEKKNFVSLAVQQDLLLLSGDERACGGTTYRCFDSDAEFTGVAYSEAGNGVSGGFALATTRLLLGYDRLLFEQLLAGARVGFAFGGAPKDFLPLHVELRGQYYFAERPFARTGLRPYAGFGLGLAQIDAKVTVEVYADEPAYLAGDARKLDAWRKTGQWFVAPTVGAGYAFGASSSVFAELRTTILLGDWGFAPALALGYAHAF